MSKKELYVYLVTLAGLPLRELAGPFDSANLAREAYRAKEKIEPDTPFDRETTKCVVIASQTLETLKTKPALFDMSHPQTEQLEPGTLVVCRYRFPSPYQPWVAPFWVGVIEAPGTDPALWNKQNSEAHYCKVCGYSKVRYEFGVMHDCLKDLYPITREQAYLPVRDKILLFLGAEALRHYDLSM